MVSLPRGLSRGVFSLDHSPRKVEFVNLCDPVPCLGQSSVIPTCAWEGFPQDVGGIYRKERKI